MPKLAPAQASPMAEPAARRRAADAADAAAAAIARATAALARLRANAAARDSLAEYDLLSARAECYSQRGDTAAAEADLVALARLAQELNDPPRQLAAMTRLYEHEHRARIELEQRLAARATELEIINGIGQALAQQLELQAV